MLATSRALRSLAPARTPPRTRTAMVAAAKDVTHEAATIAGAAKRVAVVGVRPPTPALANRPAAFVPAALAADGVAIVPIPITPALEAESYFGAVPLTLADLARVPPVDCVVFFRKPADLPPAAEVVAALTANKGSAAGAAMPVAWLQSGIRAPAWETDLLAGGVPVVADRCIKVERARARL